MTVVERFLKYVTFDTTSNESSVSVPSTKGQMILAQELKKELEELGLKTTLDDKGYLFGYLKGSQKEASPVLGLLAHLDTSPDMSGKNVKPRVVSYTGGDIVLNEKENIVLKVDDFPALENYIGQDLIVTDGTTLLGADNKAGIAEIMALLEELKNNPDLPHGEIRVAFTPDEEIGRGPHHFDVKAFGADLAYTVDGGPLGELEYENFNAASALVQIKGRNVHPGTAKDKMVNSIFIAKEYMDLFDPKDTPEHTEGYEGFFHLNEIKGDVEGTTLYYIIRDFEEESFSKRKTFMEDNANSLNKKYGEATVKVIIKDQYRNMKEKIRPHMELIENAKVAMENAGVKPVIKPIRGGTDGAQLSYMGLPCPNLFTGGENYHGRFEFISVDAMKKSVEVLVNLVSIYAKNS